MKKTQKRKDGNRTGFASELYVLYLLQRSGANAYMTFGNTKKVDIVVQKGNEAFTVDVKGGSNSFPINKNYKDYLNDTNHFFIFVDYGNNFENTSTNPTVFIVPASEMKIVHTYKCKNNGEERFNVFKSDLEGKFYADFSIFVEGKETK